MSISLTGIPHLTRVRIAAVGTTTYCHISSIISRWYLPKILSLVKTEYSLKLPQSTPSSRICRKWEDDWPLRQLTNKCLLHWTWLLKYITTNSTRKDRSRQQAKLKWWFPQSTFTQQRGQGQPYQCVSCKNALPFCFQHSLFHWEFKAYPCLTCRVNTLYFSKINQCKVEWKILDQ